MRNVLLWLVLVTWAKYAKSKIDLAWLSRPSHALVKENEHSPIEGTLAPPASTTKRVPGMITKP